MNASNYLETKILNSIFRSSDKLYLALYKTNPTDADTGAEVNNQGYLRAEVSFNAPIQNADEGVITNSVNVEFATAEEDWGEVSHFGVRDSKTGGNLLVYGSFSKPTKINQGNKFIIEKGKLEIMVG